jgi:hypothetical protein
MSGTSEVVGTRPLFAQKIVGIHELAQAEREAPTTDAAAQTISQMLQSNNPLIQVLTPGRGEPLPVPAAWRAAVRQAVEGFSDAPEGNAHGLGGSYERHSPKYLPRKPPLVPCGARAVDQTFGLIEVKGRDGDTAPGGYLAYGQFARRRRGCGHVLTSTLLEV